MDVDHDGFITKDELQKAFKSQNSFSINPDEIARIIKAYDTNDDGKLSRFLRIDLEKNCASG